MINDKPLVSIITPCYNGEAFVHRYFEGILSQTYSNIEVIFINDGSTDRTEQIALAYGEKLREKGIDFTYIFQDNAGQSVAVNKGLKLFRGQYLIWPDSDDWMDAEHIEKEVEFLEQNPDKAIALCKVAYVNENGDILSFNERKNKDKGNIFEDLININDIYFAAGAYMVRTKEFLQTNPDRSIYESRGGQNWQLLLPICYKYECGFIDAKMYNIYVRSNSHSREKTDYKRAIERRERLEDVLLNTIDRIDMPESKKKEYKEHIRLIYLEKRFDVSVHYRNRKQMKTYYCILLKNGLVTKKTRWRYIIGRSFILSLCFRAYVRFRNLFRL